METRLFKTLVKRENNLGCNEYVLGRITGIMLIMCDRREDKLKNGYAMEFDDRGITVYVNCTEGDYFEFAAVVDELYPGLCVFDA